MSYCINPKCPNRENPEDLANCQSCGSNLLIGDRYRILRPLREPNPAYPTDIFEITDWGEGEDNWGALKVMKVLKYSNNPDLVRLFKQEARVLMWLKHDGIPRVDPDGYFTVSPSKRIKQLHCLVMQKIEGENLDKWLETNSPISEERALEWLSDIANILHQVHSLNLLHRDIKPSNLMLKPNGDLALIDFGTVGESERGETRVGTSGYAAPEQIIGKAVPQSDFFALGRTFVHLVTSIPPMDFPESPPGQLVWRDLAPQISLPLANFIDELMAPAPEHRPPNTRTILNRLKNFSQPSQKHKPGDFKFYLKLAGLFLIGAFLSNPTAIFLNNFVSPQIARAIFKIGVNNFSVKQLESAEFYFRWALKFDPNYGNALYNLGWVCEEQGDLACARENYDMAIERGGNKAAVFARNNKSRLLIWRDGEYAAAIDLIQKGFKLATYTELTPEEKSILHKNFGWALLEQGRYGEAEAQLKQAIALNSLNSESPDAHCLLGRVLEGKGDKTGAMVEWKNCLHYDANTYNSEVNTWQGVARERLNAIKEAGAVSPQSREQKK